MSRDDDLIKYPRTPHLHSSRRAAGDDLDAVAFAAVAGRHLVVEEKLDGANAAISFTASGELRLQSRGHFLSGGGRERHFALLKAWASVHRNDLWAALGDRYVCYLENLQAKHTLFYNQLTAVAYEFDCYDRREQVFLDTPSRHALLAGTPVQHVPVLATGTFDRLEDLTGLVGPSQVCGGGVAADLEAAAAAAGLDPARVVADSDVSGIAEGLYIKVEAGGQVVERLKWVRPDFVQAILDSGTHWLDRPMVANRFADGVDLYA